MPTRARDGTSLPKLVKMAVPICKQAQRQCPRTGPGRPQNFEDWKMTVLIMAAILKRCKSKLETISLNLIIKFYRQKQ